MTARHVIEEFWFRLGNGLPFFGARELKGEFVVIAVQYPGEKDDPALWRAEVGWGSQFTDVMFLSLTPANRLAEQNVDHNWAKLDLGSPIPGESVVGFGYAASRASW